MNARHGRDRQTREKARAYAYERTGTTEAVQPVDDTNEATKAKP